MKKPITLIGFMGSGKSTIGRQLAPEINYNFLDLDKYIEESAGLTISDIFDKKGEDGFREIESACLKDVLTFPGFVIALGGGTPCYHNNMELIKGSSASIYLKISPEALSKRLVHSHTPRPLIKGKTEDQLLDYIRIELEKREEYYLQAEYVIESDRIQLNDLLLLGFS